MSNPPFNKMYMSVQPLKLKSSVLAKKKDGLSGHYGNAILISLSSIEYQSRIWNLRFYVAGIATNPIFHLLCMKDKRLFFRSRYQMGFVKVVIWMGLLGTPINIFSPTLNHQGI